MGAQVLLERAWHGGRLRRTAIVLASVGVTLTMGAATAQSTFDAERAALVAAIERDFASSGGRLAAPVAAALRAVPRHEFVPEQLRGLAYRDRPLPIGAGQTISQPFIVALMTDLARVDAASVVLEIGTGSGYQAAVLAEIARHVYTIEIIETLGRTAEATLARLGYDNVSVRIGDGYAGWPEHAPFDAIVVTAAPEEVPQPLLEQLRRGGRLVIPVGPEDEVQSLRVIEKDEDGALTSTDVLPVAFVPFVRPR